MITVISYCLFALLVVGATMVKRRVPRQLMLLAASYLFYSTWGLAFLAILVSSSLFNFFYGEFLKRRPSLGRLAGGVAANVLLIAFFKGTHLAIFVNSHAMDVLRGIAMPLGISFWTFQALSYLFDVYREEELDPTPVEFCLYMAFWPTVVMGPICRLGNMLPQFREVRVVSSENVLIGSKRILMGLVMKLGISQILAVGLVAGTGVSAAFDQQSVPYGGLDVWFLAIGYGLQLFFDFAGYSHIVIGAARLFGFELAENFNSPFIASTPSEFWTRWHMTLTSWIRDYVFVPMATLRRDVWWRYAALLFGVTGQFVTAVSLIPLIFVVFLSILHNGSESVTPFVYAPF